MFHYITSDDCSFFSFQIFIHGLVNNEHEQAVSFSRPVKAVAINPGFTRGAKQVVAGDDKVCAYSVTILLLLMTVQQLALFMVIVARQYRCKIV